MSCRIEQMGAVLGLLDQESTGRALLFHDRILPAAWLGAFAVIAIAAGQIVGEQGSGRKAMHIAPWTKHSMSRRSSGNVGANITHGLQSPSRGPTPAASTKLVEGVRSLIIKSRRPGWRRAVQIQTTLTGHHHHTNIGDDQRVHAGVFELADVLAHGFDLVVAQQHVARSRTRERRAFMGVARSFLRILKAKVFGAAIACRRLCRHSRRRRHHNRPAVFRPLRFAGRGQHFGLFAGGGGSSSYSSPQCGVVVAV